MRGYVAFLYLLYVVICTRGYPNLRTASESHKETSLDSLLGALAKTMISRSSTRTEEL